MPQLVQRNCTLLFDNQLLHFRLNIITMRRKLTNTMASGIQCAPTKSPAQTNVLTQRPAYDCRCRSIINVHTDR